jgi:hypothetical protein
MAVVPVHVAPHINRPTDAFPPIGCSLAPADMALQHLRYEPEILRSKQAYRFSTIVWRTLAGRR